MTDEIRHAGYTDFIEALAAGEPYYLESPSGNGWLPPRRMDPETGERDFEKVPLPDTGEILTTTTTHVAGPSFADDVPYVVAIADFGPVRLTGQLHGNDSDDVEIGDVVTVGVGTNENGERLVVFERV